MRQPPTERPPSTERLLTGRLLTGRLLTGHLLPGHLLPGRPPAGRRIAETAAWLDERLPARRPRRALRRWRRTRPFWGGALTIAGGTTILTLPLAPLPIMIHVGTAAISGLAIGAILVAAGLFFWFAPAQRSFVAIVSTICALVSVVTSNMGGLGFGALEALLGSAMAFGWKPHPKAVPAHPDPSPLDAPAEPLQPEVRPARHREADERGAEPGDPNSTVADLTTPIRSAEPPPPLAEVDNEPTWPYWPGWFRRANAFALIPVVLVTGALPGRAPAAQARAPETVPTCVPVPGATRPWWIPESLWLICPDPSATPAPTGTGPVTPSPAPTAPGGTEPTPTPTTEPGSGSGSGPGGATSSGTPTPGVSMKPPPAMANPGSAAGRKYGENVPEVAADRLVATGFTFKGTLNMPTVDGGRVKALAFHADNLKADNYRIHTQDPGPQLDLGIDLDIDDVDIYATYLGGKITVPDLNIPLIDITIGADLIPAWLPLDISLPVFSGDGIEAGQVFIRAGTVRGSALSADVRS